MDNKTSLVCEALGRWQDGVDETLADARRWFFAKMKERGIPFTKEDMAVSIHAADQLDAKYRDDGTYDRVTVAATTTHTYRSGGQFTAAVRVEDDLGAQDTDTALIDVNQPPAADLVADAPAGDAPHTVNFDASGSTDSDGTIVDYEWDLDGDGVFNETGNEEDAHGEDSATCTYSNPGYYDPKVRVTDDDGATGTDSVAATIHGWALFTVDSAGSVGYSTSLAVVDGCPAISYCDWSNFDLKYARATTSTGDSAADWSQIVTVDSPGSLVREYGTSLAVVDGCPAISYYDHSNHDLKYARATTSAGSSASDWTQIVTVDSAGTVGLYTSLAVVDGCPAISYHDATNQDLKYARATTSTGGNASDWTQVITVDSDGSMGHYTSLAVVDGCPAISYRDATNKDLKYARATTSTGGDALEWTQIVTVDSTGDVGRYTSLAVVDGCPAISYCLWNSGTAEPDDLKYVRATTSTGSSASDWTQIVTVDSTGDVGGYTSLAVINGRPAISYGTWQMYNPVDLKYARATTSTGSSASDWTQIVTVDSDGMVGAYTSLAMVDGHPAISYHDDANGNLKYAICY